MAHATFRKLALEALSRALADPTPRVLHGTNAKPGIFLGSAAATKQAAKWCLENGWLQATGQFEGRGKTKKELYRLSPSGVREVLENSEAVPLLTEMRDALEGQAKRLETVQSEVGRLLALSGQHKEAIGQLLSRMQPPDVEELLRRWGQGATVPSQNAEARSPDWLGVALQYLTEYPRKKPYAHCSLAELYHRVAEPRKLTIGQFHDGLRRLAQEGQVRLHPFTGAAYQLQEEQYALLAGQEIKYYVERITGA